METKKPRGEIGRKLRDQFIAGLLVVVPLGATILILVWVFNSIDHILAPVVQAVFHRHVPGVGFAVTILLIYLAGLFATNVIGGTILRFFNRQLNKVPIFKVLYSSIRQILEAFASPEKTGFLHVVLVEFPRQGMWELGFVTNEMENENGENILNVLIPTSPTPTSGFLQIVKEKDVIRTKISVEEGLKMVVSGGTMTPDEVKNKFRGLKDMRL
jgi:uncharacterized membrane protein